MGWIKISDAATGKVISDSRGEFIADWQNFMLNLEDEDVKRKAQAILDIAIVQAEDDELERTLEPMKEYR